MRRPLNWAVVFIALAFLSVNLWFSAHKVPRAFERVERPAVAEAIPSVSMISEKPALEFGYIRTDGSFVPLTSTSPSWQ